MTSRQCGSQLSPFGWTISTRPLPRPSASTRPSSRRIVTEIVDLVGVRHRHLDLDAAHGVGSIVRAAALHADANLDEPAETGPHVRRMDGDALAAIGVRAPGAACRDRRRDGRDGDHERARAADPHAAPSPRRPRQSHTGGSTGSPCSSNGPAARSARRSDARSVRAGVHDQPRCPPCLLRAVDHVVERLAVARRERQRHPDVAPEVGALDAVEGDQGQRGRARDARSPARRPARTAQRRRRRPRRPREAGRPCAAGHRAAPRTRGRRRPRRRAALEPAHPRRSAPPRRCRARSSATPCRDGQRDRPRTPARHRASPPPTWRPARSTATRQAPSPPPPPRPRAT